MAATKGRRDITEAAVEGQGSRVKGVPVGAICGEAANEKLPLVEHQAEMFKLVKLQRTTTERYMETRIPF